MAQTPYKDLGSVNILSAYVTGLQHSVNKIEQVLGMKTGSAADHSLQPVTDQDTPSFRYRIYEGTIRNWLDYPVPTVYRNGVEVDSSEYDMSPPYGVVVFHEQQAPDDDITADFDYVTGESSTIQNLQGVSPFLQVSGSFRTHSLLKPDIATKILVYDNMLDVFPLVVREPTAFDQFGIELGSYYSSYAATVHAKVGVYKDNGSVYPGELIASGETTFTTSDTTTQKNEWHSISVPSFTLEPGLYWLGRNQDEYAEWNGISDVSAIPIGYSGGSSKANPNNTYWYGGYRTTATSGGDLPAQFPSGESPFHRGSYGSPWIGKA